jgi:hypothetical protein
MGGVAPRRPRTPCGNGWPPEPGSSGPRSPSCECVTTGSSPTSRPPPPTRRCRCAGCATSAPPTTGRSRSTAPATTTTRTRSSPADCRSGPARTPRPGLRPLSRRTQHLAGPQTPDELTTGTTSRGARLGGSKSRTESDDGVERERGEGCWIPSSSPIPKYVRSPGRVTPSGTDMPDGHTHASTCQQRASAGVHLQPLDATE